MAVLRVTGGALEVTSTDGPVGPVDPGYGRPEGPQGPVDPGFGFPLPPVRPDNGLPRPPGHPGHPLPPGPGHPGGGPMPPTYPVDPDYGLPHPPNVWPDPPRPEQPDPDYDRPVLIRPGLPIYLPPGGRPNNDLPMPPGSVWPPLPPVLDEGKILVFVWIPGVGYRWTVIDTSLKPTVPMVPPSTVPEPKQH